MGSVLPDTELPWGERGEGSTQNCLSHFKERSPVYTTWLAGGNRKLQTILTEALTGGSVILQIRAKELICYDLGEACNLWWSRGG
jgi:hypothetical protein